MLGNPLHSVVRFSRRRVGLTSIEILVSLTLLTTGMTLSASLLVQHKRLLIEQRHYRLALDEVSNQLERLSSFSPSERAAVLDELQPSAFAIEHLPDAQLRASVHDERHGQRLTVSITWDQIGTEPQPLALSAWLNADQEASP